MYGTNSTFPDGYFALDSTLKPYDGPPHLSSTTFSTFIGITWYPCVTCDTYVTCDPALITCTQSTQLYQPTLPPPPLPGLIQEGDRLVQVCVPVGAVGV